MKKELIGDCKDFLDAWELELLRQANGVKRQLHRSRKPCMIVVRWDGNAWHVHSCEPPYARIEMKK